MKLKLKKMFAVILSVIILSGILPSNANGWLKFPDWLKFPNLSYSPKAANGLVYGEDDKITRAEWLYDLSYIFNMTVESNATPDNYFSDLNSSHEYYDEIITAVNFGVVNIEAGEALFPDEPVTREFAASTLNFCLGYQLEDDAEYTFGDSAEVEVLNDAQIAINRGWLELIDGNFCPETLITEVEIRTMLSDAQTILESTVIDSSHENTYEFEDDVIVLPETVVATEDENGVVTIPECPVEISTGDKFAVYFNGIPVIYTAESVEKENNTTVVTTISTDELDGFTSIDAQGIIDSDSIEIIPADGVEVEVEEESVSTFSARATKNIKNINASKSVKIVDGVTANISATIKNPYIEYSVSGDYVYIALNGNAEVNYGISADFISAAGYSKGITLFTCNIGGIGSFDINVVLDFSGSATGTVKGFLVAGIECTKNSGIRAIKSFTQSEYYNTIQATAKVGLRATLGITKLKVVNAYVYAEIGARAEIESKTYSDENLPNKCTHFEAFLYANYGASASIKLGKWSESFNKNYTIFDRNNSPVRILHHYEDGTEVAKCTRGNIYSNFFTKGSSRYGGSGWSGANGAYGLNADGTPFELYNYTVSGDTEIKCYKIPLYTQDHIRRILLTELSPNHCIFP